MAQRPAARRSQPQAPSGCKPLPADIGHQAAQAELDTQLFPHYLLGRQLALEEVVREIFSTLPPDQRAQAADRLRFHTDLAMQRLSAGIADPQEDAATCGYVCTLLQQHL